MLKKIIWEAWENPITEKIEEIPYDEDRGVDYVDTGCQVIAGPLGVLPVQSLKMIDETMEFWVLHSNFDITPVFISSLNKVPGVESIEVYSRYRLRIGFPKTGLFDSVKTKRLINDMVRQLNEAETLNIEQDLVKRFNLDIADKFNKAKDHAQKSNHWILYISPNGHIDITTSNDYTQDFCDQLRTLRETELMVGGYLLTNDNS